MSDQPSAAAANQPDRARQILRTAAELFAARGFREVSVHDIGAACGISGPALYKHFRSKDEILARSLADISAELLETGRRRASAETEAGARLAALIEWHIDFAVEYPAFIVLQEREWPRLDAEARETVRTLQLDYVDLWVDTVLVGRDDWDRADARVAVQAVFGLLNSTPHSARVGEARLRSLLTDLATGALSA